MENENTKITITLSSFQWGRLVDDLREHLRICNRDSTTTLHFCELISTAMNDGKPVKFIHPQNPDPKYRPKEETSENNTHLQVPPIARKEAKSGFFSRWFK